MGELCHCKEILSWGFATQNKDAVLVCWVCYNKISQTGRLKGQMFMLSQLCRLEVQDQDASMARFRWEFPSWLTGSPLLTVSSGGGDRKTISFSSYSYKGYSPINWGLILRTHLNLTTFLKILSPDRAWTYEYCGDIAQFLAPLSSFCISIPRARKCLLNPLIIRGVHFYVVERRCSVAHLQHVLSNILDKHLYLLYQWLG